MFSIAGIDLLEQELLDHERTLLEILLQDKTTKKNIIWATDDYAELGEPYSFKKEILPELVTGEQDSLIQPRVEKALEHQTNRTRDKAEVFTPSWICNAQNNLVDEQWFGSKDVFNIQKEMSWKATADKIAFPDDRQHTWQKYVDAQRLEISCGEAPYLVSRYDTVTGETIPISSELACWTASCALSAKTRTPKKNGSHGQSGRSRACTALSIRATAYCWHGKTCL